MKRLALLGCALLATGLTPVGAPSTSASAPVAAESAVPSTAAPASATELRPLGQVAESVKVGDALKFTLADPSRVDASAKVGVPPEAKSLYEQGWLAKLSAEKTEGAPDQLVLTLTPVRADLTSTPELAIRDASDQWVARVLPYAIKVESVIAKDDPKAKEPDPAYPPQSARFPWVWALIIGTLALALLSGVVYLIWRRLRSRGPRPAKPMPAAPALPEDVRALESLAKLDAQGLPEKGEFKKYTFACSEILKAYLGARYQFDAPESTSAELITLLRGITEFPAARLEALEAMLGRMDVVKFTDQRPSVAESKALVPEIREIVASTRKPPQAAAATGGKP